MARRVRRLFRGGRVLDLGGGHGLLAQVMLLLDDSSPNALVIDKTLPASSAKLHDVLVAAWPRLSGRVTFVATSMDDVEILDTDIVVSSHACGALTDQVLDRAAAARARVAVLPCCHNLIQGMTADCPGGSTGPSRSTSCARCGCRSRAIASGRRRFQRASRRKTACYWASRLLLQPIPRQNV